MCVCVCVTYDIGMMAVWCIVLLSLFVRVEYWQFGFMFFSHGT